MDHSHIFIIVIELMGTIAFAISGAMVAVRCGMASFRCHRIRCRYRRRWRYDPRHRTWKHPVCSDRSHLCSHCSYRVRSCLSAGVLSPQNLIRRFSSTLCQTD